MATLRDKERKLKGGTVWIMTGCGKLYVTLNRDEEGNLVEVFTNIGKAGDCSNSYKEAASRMISILLQGGVEVKEIIKQLRNIKCNRPVKDTAFGEVGSCMDALAMVIDWEEKERGKVK